MARSDRARHCDNSLRTVHRKSVILPLHACVFKNDIAELRKCLKILSFDINCQDAQGRTALHIGAIYNRRECVQVLLSSPGCDVNLLDNDGKSPLLLGVESGDAGLVRVLLECGMCHVNSADKNGQTPLILASYYGYTEILRLLLLHGVALDQGDNLGKTALMYALEEGNDTTAILLIRSGSDVNRVDDEGHSALYIALHSTYLKDVETVRAVLDAGYVAAKDNHWLDKEPQPSLLFNSPLLYNYICVSARIHPHQGTHTQELFSEVTNENLVRQLRKGDLIFTSGISSVTEHFMPIGWTNVRKKQLITHSLLQLTV